jgi:hypothetical protein
MAQPEHERQAMIAQAWKSLEKASMYVAKQSANLAAEAEKQYRQTVSI